MSAATTTVVVTAINKTSNQTKTLFTCDSREEVDGIICEDISEVEGYEDVTYDRRTRSWTGIEADGTQWKISLEIANHMKF